MGSQFVQFLPQALVYQDDQSHRQKDDGQGVSEQVIRQNSTIIENMGGIAALCERQGVAAPNHRSQDNDHHGNRYQPDAVCPLFGGKRPD